MKCTNCGKEINGEVKYCPYCGTEVSTLTSVAEIEESNAKMDDIKQNQHEESKKYTSKRIIVILILAVAIVGIMVGIFIKKNNTVPTKISKMEKQKFGEKDPEKFINKIYKKMYSDDCNYSEIWDEYVSDTTKESGWINRKEYIQFMENFFFENDIIYKDYKIQSVEEMGNDVFWVKSRVKYDINGNEETDSMNDYVIKEDGLCKYLMNGVLSGNTYGDSDEKIESEQPFIVDDLKSFQAVDGMIVRYKLTNASGSKMAHGWTSGPTIEIETTEGSYSTALDMSPDFLNISDGASIDESCTFKEAKGSLKSITINNLNILNNNGLPIDFSGGNSYKISIS